MISHCMVSKKLFHTPQRILLLSVALCYLCVAGVSQSELRSLTGVVTDKQGNLLRGAVVELENRVTLQIRSYITGNDGRYYFGSLSGDVDYNLRARYHDKWSRSKTLSKFSSARHPEIALIIPTG